MKGELAEEIARLAAPIYAAFLQMHAAPGKEIPAETLNNLRGHAIIQAHALWLQTLDTDP
jgi:hypothetical protein